MALAVAHVGGLTSESNPAMSDVWAATAGSLIVVIGHLFGTTAVANGDITDGGNSYTLVASSLGGAGAVGIAMWYNNAGTRSGTHQVAGTWTGGTGSTSIIEITGQDPTSAVFDGTTDATATDGVSAYNITAAGAISGNQIAIYGVTVDGFANNAFTQPGGYTVILTQPDGTTHLIFDSAYKINETGTPTVGATRAESTTVAREVFATFKEAGGGGGPAPPDLYVVQSNMHW